MKYNKLIDHTNLKQDAVEAEIVTLCNEAKEHDFASVCVNSAYVSLCHNLLQGTDVKVCTVVGFPLGQCLTVTKINETREAIFCGAEEIDMVINVSWLKDKKYDEVEREIYGIKQECGEKHILKVILEVCLLTDEEIVKACELSVKAGADFVKTSTGFAKGGATVHAVELMRKTVGPNVGVKAAGGIRTKEDLEAMVNAGANRIGTSRGVELVK